MIECLVRCRVLHATHRPRIARPATGFPEAATLREMKMGTGNTRLPLQLYAASHRASCHWDVPEKAARPALTREPGDLPVAVVFRPARVRRTDG